jgi:hypothetical protein
MTMALEKTRLHTINIINRSHFYIVYQCPLNVFIPFAMAMQHFPASAASQVMVNGNMIPGAGQDCPAPHLRSLMGGGCA